MRGCLTPDELRDLLRGTTPSEAQQTGERHLEVCERCRAALEALAGSPAPFRGRLTTSRAASSPGLEAALHRLSGLHEKAGADPAAEALAAILERLKPSAHPGSMGRLGGYDVLETIEAGGMGIVLRAFDPSLQRVVALKVLYPMLAASPAARQRFLREARLAAAIHHEQVVRIYAVAEANGLPFIAMELIEGESLARRLERAGALPVTEVIRLGREIAAGLAAAHAQGIIHRDIKPANVLLETGTGRAKLTDFGLARAVDDTGLTRGGLVPGTPEYLAPECAQGGPADERSDLFSLGCVLYAMAAGRSPFRAETTLATLRRVCDTTPEPLHRGRRAAPRWLGELVEQLLDKVPARRPGSAAEVRMRLEQGGTRDRLRPRSRWVRLAGGVLGMVILLGAGWLFNKARVRQAGASPDAALGRERVPFVVYDEHDRRLSGHEDIQNAILAVPSNGILRLCWDGPRVMPPVTLPPRPLSVRRKQGFQPLWIATHTNGPALRATAPLMLAGPEFEYRPPASVLRPATDGSGPKPEFPGDAAPVDLSLVQVSGARLLVSGCRFKADFGRAAGPVGFACVELVDCPVAEIETSAFDAPRSSGVRWRLTGRGRPGQDPPATLEIRTSGILVGDAVWMSISEDRPARLSTRDCSFDGRSFVFLAPEMRRAASLAVEVGSGLFRPDWILIDRRRDDSAALPEWMSWSWKPTICRPGLGYIPSRTPGGGPWVRTAEEWERLWAVPAASTPPR